MRSNMVNRCFCVADLVFTLRLPGQVAVDSLLPLFRPFRCAASAPGGRLFRCTVLPAAALPEGVAGHLADEVSAAGLRMAFYAVPGGYRVEAAAGGAGATLLADDGFADVRLWADLSAPQASRLLTALLGVAWSQALLRRGGVAVRAWAEVRQGRAYVFVPEVAPAAPWLLQPDGGTLALRVVDDDMALAYATPWSHAGCPLSVGGCSFPVGGVARLCPSSSVRFRRQGGVDAFAVLYPGCAVVGQDDGLRNRLYDVLARLASVVSVGTLHCPPGLDAVRLLRQEAAPCMTEP